MLSATLSLQVGNNDVDDVNIIVFRQINQFDLSGNVITSSEYLSTLWVRPTPSEAEFVLSDSVGDMSVPAGSGFRGAGHTAATPGFGADYRVMRGVQFGVAKCQVFNLADRSKAPRRLSIMECPLKDNFRQCTSYSSFS